MLPALGAARFKEPLYFKVNGGEGGVEDCKSLRSGTSNMTQSGAPALLHWPRFAAQMAKLRLPLPVYRTGLYLHTHARNTRFRYIPLLQDVIKTKTFQVN
uniref:Uncharacterized protein n=1 Tax=Timema genevievae TaxID=629358 RepID=A0A7R9JNT5_TIMGE|nr:unnamed protein product [Timema genevievae]